MGMLQMRASLPVLALCEARCQGTGARRHDFQGPPMDHGHKCTDDGAPVEVTSKGVRSPTVVDTSAGSGLARRFFGLQWLAGLTSSIFRRAWLVANDEILTCCTRK